MNGFNPAVLVQRGVVVLALGGATAASGGDSVLFFETFDSGSISWTHANLDPTWDGWRAIGGNPDGCFVLNSGGFADSDPTVQTTITGLVKGRTYRIEGDFKDYYNWCPQPTQTSFRVEFNGTTVYSSARAAEWTHFQAEWVANSTQVTIRIRAETDGTDCDAAVDNIKLTEVLPCLSDISGDYQVDGVDLAMVLSAWGLVNSPANIDRSASSPEVDGQDLAFVLSGWGPCP